MSEASEPHETCFRCGALVVHYDIGHTADGDPVCGDCINVLKLDECPRCGTYIDVDALDEFGICASCWSDVASRDD
jgi:hypothetical protein